METIHTPEVNSIDRLSRQQHFIPTDVQEKMNEHSLYVIGGGTVGAGFISGAASVANLRRVYVSDADDVSSTNMNRLPLFFGRIGDQKVDVLNDFLSHISPETIVTAKNQFDTPASIEEVINDAAENRPSLVVSACDNLPLQAALHLAAFKNKVDVVLPTDIAAKLQVQYFPYSQDNAKLYNGKIKSNLAQYLASMYGQESEIDAKSKMKYLIGLVGIRDLDSKMINAFIEAKKDGVEWFPQCIMSAGLIPGVAAALLEKHALGEEIKKRSVIESYGALSTTSQKIIEGFRKVKALKSLIDSSRH